MLLLHFHVPGEAMWKERQQPSEKVIYIWSMRGGAMGRMVKTNRDRMFLYKPRENRMSRKIWSALPKIT